MATIQRHPFVDAHLYTRSLCSSQQYMQTPPLALYSISSIYTSPTRTHSWSLLSYSHSWLQECAHVCVHRCRGSNNSNLRAIKKLYTCSCGFNALPVHLRATHRSETTRRTYSSHEVDPFFNRIFMRYVYMYQYQSSQTSEAGGVISYIYFYLFLFCFDLRNPDVTFTLPVYVSSNLLSPLLELDDAYRIA